MNKITILAISAVFVASILAISAFEAEALPPADPVAEAIDRLTAVMVETTTQGPQGETGPQGEQGETGPSGTELYTKTQSFAVIGETRQLVTQNCNTGDTVINGYLVGQAFSPHVIIDTNQFASQHNDPNGWVIEFATTLNPEDPFDFVIVCAEGSLPEN